MENRSIEELKSGFERFYTERLLPIAQGTEKIRQKYLHYLTIGCLFAFVTVPAIILWIINYQEQLRVQPVEDDWKMPTAYFAIMVIIAIASSPLYLYRKKSKNQLMPEFIKYFDGFSYQFEGTVNSAVVEKSRLINDYNTRSGDDYFSGTYKNVEMIVSEEKFEKVSTTYNNGKRQDHRTTIFDGILVLLSLNKDFSGQTVVFQDKGMLNKIVSFTRNLSGLENIRLEDSIFEKEFEAYGTNQVEARYLLTTAFMERMLKLREAYKANRIEFSFFDNRLFITLKTSENMFEATSLFKSCLDRTLIDNTFNQFLSIMAIIDILKLDKIQYTG